MPENVQSQYQSKMNKVGATISIKEVKVVWDISFSLDDYNEFKLWVTEMKRQSLLFYNTLREGWKQQNKNIKYDANLLEVLKHKDYQFSFHNSHLSSPYYLIISPENFE